MAGTTIIGKVGVKVYPVTDDFWRKVKREVEQGEGRVEAEVPVNLEDERIRRDMRDLLKDLRRQIDRSDLEAKVDLDASGVVAQAKKIDRQIKDQLDDVKVKVRTEQAGTTSDANGDKAIRDLRGRLRLEKAVTKANADAARSQSQAEQSVGNQLKTRLRIEEMVGKANKDAARDAEREAKAMEQAAAEAAKLRREVGKLEFDRKFQADAKRNRALLEDIDKEIRSIDHHLDEDLRIKISGMSEAEREIDKLKLKLEETNAKITPEIDEFSRRRLIHEAENLKDEIEKKTKDLPISFDMDSPTVAIRYLGARLAILARDRFVTYIPMVSKAAAAKAATALAALSGARLGGKLLEDLGDLVKNLDKNIPLIATLGTGIAGLAGWALSASANLFSISTELARIGPLALALPGILGGLAIGAGITVIALADLKNQIPQVSAAWDGLKKTIRGNFWAAARKPIAELGRELFPDLNAGIGKASTEIGKFFAAFSDALSGELKGNPLRNMFEDLRESIDIATDRADSFAKIIRILGEQGAGLLPRLAGYFGDVTDKFAEFLDKAQKSGELQAWVDDAITSLKQLGNAVRQIGRFLGGLGKIANKAGGSTFVTIGETFEKAADAINGAHFQNQMVEVLLAADKAMDNIAKKSGPGLTRFFNSLSTTAMTVLPQVGNIIGTALGGIADALSGSGFQTGVQRFFDGVLSLVTSLQPAMRPLADALGAVLTLAGRMATAFGPSLATILTTVANVAKIIGPYLGSAVEALAGPFGNVLKEIAPSVERIAKALGPEVVDLARGLGGALEKIKPNVGKVFDRLADFVEKGSGFSAKDWTKFFSGVGDIANLALDSLGAIIEFGSWLNGPGGQNSIASAERIATAIEGIGAAAKAADELVKTLSGDADFFGTKANKEKSPDKKFDLKRYIADTFANNPALGTLLGPVGSIIIDGLVNGFESAKRDVMIWLQALTNLIPSWKGPSAVDAVLLTPNGYSIIMSLIAGFIQARPNVMNWLKGLTEAIKNAFTGAGEWLVDKGKAIGNGFARGIGSAVRAVGRAGRDLVSAVKDATDNGGALTGRGSAMGGGFARGLSSRVGAARVMGEALAVAARSGAGSVSAAGVGGFFGAGFVRGVRGKVGAAYAAGAALGAAAKRGAEDAGSVASPAKEMIKVGKFYGAGMEIGLQRKTADVGAAGYALGKTALEAADAPHKAMYDSGNRVGNAFAEGITAASAAVQKSVTGLTDGLASGDLSVSAGKVSGAVAAEVKANLVDPSTTSTAVPAPGPVVENLTLVTSGDVGEDLSEIEFELRRIGRGGVHG